MKPLFSIKDRAIDGFNVPFSDHSHQSAIRAFRDEVNKPPEQSQVAKHPDDYDIYCIGEFNAENGTLVPLEQPELIARGKDLVNPRE